LHITKRNRPFASGALPLYYGVIAPPILLVFSAILMAFTGYYSGLFFLAIYLAATFLYSFWLKQVAGVDIVFLAGLYIIRLILGGEVADVEISGWLLAFSTFFFLTLALAKRYPEVYQLGEEKNTKIASREYVFSDTGLVAMFGASSGYVSVLVLALYANSQHVVSLYQHPKWIFLVCLIMLAWVTRMWLLTHRGVMDQDPIAFAIKDKFSYGTLVLMGIVVLLAGPL
jgi:4-hydroxybenzoate polyprenyltransferase